LRILILNDHQRLSPRVALEAKSLSEEHEVWILNWNRSGHQDLSSPEKGLNIEWIHLKAPQGQIGLILYLPLLYWAIAKRVKWENVDVVHCTHLFLLPIAGIIGKMKGAKIVYDVYERHSITMSYYFPFSKLARYAIEWLENQWVKRIDAVLTVDSPDGFLEKRYKKYNSHVQVLFNVPLEHSDHESDSHFMRKKEQGNKIIVYVGGLTRDKGILQAIETMQIIKDTLPDAKLLLIGTFHFHDAKDEAIQLIERYELSACVEVIEWVPYAEMMKHLRKAGVGIALHQPHEKFRYVSKGTGRKFFTYMQAALPIVGPEFGEVGQVVREEKCGILVDTTDPQQIADAIIYLLKHPEEASAMGEWGRRAIEEKYNWEIEKEKLLKVYRNLDAR